MLESPTCRVVGEVTIDQVFALGLDALVDFPRTACPSAGMAPRTNSCVDARHSLETQSDHGVNMRRATGWQIGGHAGDGSEGGPNRRKRRHVQRL